MKICSLSLLLFISGISAWAAGPNVRLDLPPGSMAHVTIRDQGDYGDCYAAVAAELIDAYRFSHGDSRFNMPASALKLAVDFKRLEHEPSVNGGNPCGAINVLRQKSPYVCDDARLKMRNGEPVERYSARYYDTQVKIAQIYQFQDQLNDLVTRFKADLHGPAPRPHFGSATPTRPQPATSHRIQFCAAQNRTGSVPGVRTFESDPTSSSNACGPGEEIETEASMSGFRSIQNYLNASMQLDKEIASTAVHFLLSTYNGKFAADIKNNIVKYSALREKQRQEAERFGQQILTEMKQQGLDAQKLPTLRQMIGAVTDTKQTDFLNGLLASECSGSSLMRMPAEMPACSAHSFFNSNGAGCLPPNFKQMESVYAANVRRQIDAVLSAPHAQPVSIATCEEILQQGNSFHSYASILGPSHCSQHALVVVGRRTNPKTGQVEYLVRNSWGTSCYGYSKDIQCEPGHGLWINAEALSRNVFDVQWI